MADIHSTNSNYVRYVLFSETKNPLITAEPTGWKDDEIELTRNEEYHGIFFSFTGGLKFYGEAKEYIKSQYDILGVNAKLLLVKQKLRDVDGEVKFTDDYSAFADFKTMIVSETDLTVNFNSYDIAEVLKSYEDDDFEMETTTDVNGDPIETIEIQTTTLRGRSLSESNEHNLYPGFGQWSGGYFTPQPDNNYQLYVDIYGVTPLTTLVSDSGSGRISSVDSFKASDVQDLTASNMFLTAVDDSQQQLTSEVTLSFDIGWKYIDGTSGLRMQITVIKYKWNPSSDEYAVEEVLYTKNYQGENNVDLFDSMQEINVTCLWDEALGLRIRPLDNRSCSNLYVNSLNIVIRENSFFEQTQDAQFLYTHDVAKRLAYIMSGQKNSFYSKFFGRTGTEEEYAQDGEAGRIGNISGLWARGFVPSSNNYKSIQTSFKDWFDSAKATWNVGLGVDNVRNKERIRVEKLKFFYQNDVVIKLPNQVNNVVRKVDASLFFSGVEMSYQQGGDYSDTMGLDEPNTTSNWVTAISKSDLKYKQTSSIRADDYGLEETRRKPQISYPDEDTQRDESLWWLDMVYKNGIYEQAIWSDPGRLAVEPRYIYDPSTFYGMRFTPQQMLFRHGWVIRAGLEKYTTKYIVYGSSKANNKIVMQFDGEPEFQANDNLFVSDLERSRILPEIIEFEHPVDDELMDLINGYTQIIYEGSAEFVRNFYFKIEFINEDGQIEKGYIKSLKPKGKGKWIVQKSNEELLGDPGVPKIARSFAVNLEEDKCSEGILTFPDLLYFEADEDEYYPVLGQIIYTDQSLFNVSASTNTIMSNGTGLETDANGASISFTCS